MGCIACGRGFHKECMTGCKRCHPNDSSPETMEIEAPALLGRTKADADIRDPHSTGRKRAAELYPLDTNLPCEWQGKKNCGGGRFPIIGCLANTQAHRHHGPVKNTLRNQSGNVHRICTSCHIHWHELNDTEYDEKDYGLLPHQPEPADDVEIVQNALDWSSGEIGKRFTLASSVNKGLKNASED